MQDLLKISDIGNDLEKIAVKMVPKINLILNSFKKNSGCLKFGMSGSGPTCYGIFENRKKAFLFEKNIKRLSSQRNYWTWSGGLLSNSKRNLILPI